MLEMDLLVNLKENKMWLKQIGQLAEIKTENDRIIIESTRGVKFKSVIPRFLKTNEETFYFLGLLTGDSCSRNQTSARFGISNTEINLIRKAREVLENEFLQPKDKIKLEIEHDTYITEKQTEDLIKILKLQKNNVKFRVNKTCKEINFELFVNNRPLKRIIFSKIIPKVPEINNNNLLKSFLAGLIDSDGEIRKDYISITLSLEEDIKITNQIIKKLFNFDIHLTRRKNKSVCDVRIYGTIEKVPIVIKEIKSFLLTEKGLPRR